MTRGWMVLGTVMAVAMGGCTRLGAFVCDKDERCGSDAASGICEATGYCSRLDSTCPAPIGRRYAAGSPLGGTCVATILGNLGAIVSNDRQSPGKIEAYRYVARATGRLYALHLHASSATPDASVLLLGIYEDMSDPDNPTRHKPAGLIDSASTSGYADAAGWQLAKLSHAVAVQSGSAYWLALVDPHNTVIFDKAADKGEVRWTDDMYTALPGAWATGCDLGLGCGDEYDQQAVADFYGD